MRSADSDGNATISQDELIEYLSSAGLCDGAEEFGESYSEWETCEEYYSEESSWDDNSYSGYSSEESDSEDSWGRSESESESESDEGENKWTRQNE